MLDNATVVFHETLGDPYYRIKRLVLKTRIATEAKPGQFVHIQVAAGLDPLLRRPISIAAIDPLKEEITLLYRIRGKGTEILAEAKVGVALNLMGPLGRGFSIPEKGELLLVAGGIGVFPLLAVAQQAIGQHLPVRLLWGGENAAFLESSGLRLWQEAGIPVQVSTLDGSAGVKGNVLDLIKDRGLLNHKSQEISLAVCGPHSMMEAVSEYALALGGRVEVSLEERMGCAVGACLGCVCTLKDLLSGKVKRAKVCQDGPVFDASEVLWNDNV